MERESTSKYSRTRRVGAHRMAYEGDGGWGKRYKTRKADMESNGEQNERSSKHEIAQGDKGKFVVTAGLQCN